ncbi:M48 family metalloprotease [bacterium]|nr:M48 family metalloprotease [bacterium]
MVADLCYNQITIKYKYQTLNTLALTSLPMYQSFIFYIIVIVTYTARPEPDPKSFQAGLSLLLVVTLLTLLYGAARWRCRSISVNISDYKIDREQLPALYDRVQLQLQIGAVIVFSVMVYGADLGGLIELLPLVKSSEGVSSVLGLGIFFLLQIIIWRECHGYFAEQIILIKPCSSYIKARLRFALGLMIPWLSLLLIIDLLNFAIPKSVTLLLQNPLGEIALFVAFLLLLTTIAPPLLVRLWGCRNLPESALRHAVVKLCQAQGVGYRQIMLWPSFEGRMATAAVVGAFPFSRYLLLTPDLIHLLNGEEIIAVTSHELGHVRYRHLLFFLLFFLSFFLFNFLYYNIGIAWLLTTAPIIALLENGFENSQLFFSLLEVLPLLILYFLFFRYIFGFFLRNFERQADLASLDPPNLGPELVSAFIKLGFLLGSAGTKPNWHHFNIPQRVAFLKAAISNPAVARKHHLYIKRSLALYVIFFTLIILPGIYWQRSDLDGKLHYQHLSKRLEYRLKKSPDKPELWFLLSSIYIETNQEDKAVNALDQARRLKPKDPEIMNNLAWLLLTSKDQKLRDPSQALNLAQRAATLNQTPYILDTLAEAYWYQGNPEMAIIIAEKILKDHHSPDQKEYYQQQLNKFRYQQP